MFRGYSGYIQADAHAMYDALFCGKGSAGIFVCGGGLNLGKRKPHA
jgi:hypothetical protein